jgi:hypothetical protein
MPSWKAKICGINSRLFLSIIMEYMDNGDLYQSICDKKKKSPNNYFDEN